MQLDQRHGELLTANQRQPSDTESASAIVVLYHSDHLVPDLLHNLQEHLPEINEVILVDNGGTLQPMPNNPRVRVIHPEKNLGYGGAINAGLGHATNNSIIILNPDIAFVRARLHRPTEEADKFIAFGTQVNSTCGFAFPSPWKDLAFMTLRKLGTPFQFIESWRLAPPMAGHPLARIDWQSGAVIHTTRATLSSLKGFDEEFFLFYEEVDLALRAKKIGISVILNRELAYRELKGKSSSSNVSVVKFSSESDSFIRYHRKHSTHIQASFVAWVFGIFWFTAWIGMLPISFISIKYREKSTEAHIRWQRAWAALFDSKSNLIRNEVENP